MARAWNLERLWERTTAAIDHVLGDEQAGFAVRRLTRQMGSMRGEQTVIGESRARRVGGAVSWPVPGCGRLRASAHQVGLELRPTGGETWGRMLDARVEAWWQSFSAVASPIESCEKGATAASPERARGNRDVTAHRGASARS